MKRERKKSRLFLLEQFGDDAEHIVHELNLKGKEAEVAKLRFVDGRQYKEIADIVCTSESNLRRISAKIHDRITEYRKRKSTL